MTSAVRTLPTGGPTVDAVRGEGGSIAGRVYVRVKARILLGQARPGDIIAAHELAQSLAISRTPVHEALKRLVGEGYLVAEPRVGYRVTPFNLDEIRDLFQVRARLEALSAETAAKAWNEQHRLAFAAASDRARHRQLELKRQGSTFELAQFAHDEHKRFHWMIASVGGNHRLERLILELQDETQRFWSLLPNEDVVNKVFLDDEDHRKILEAIAARDPLLARTTIVEHMQASVRQMIDAVVPELPPGDDLGI